MEEQNKCFTIDPEFESEERQLVRKTVDLFAQELCPAEPINIIRDEHLGETGQLAREFQRPLGAKILHFIGLNPKAVKNALELEKQRRGDGVWALAWTLSHELGHYVWGKSEKLANEYASRILKRVEKEIPGWEAARTRKLDKARSDGDKWEVVNVVASDYLKELKTGAWKKQVNEMGDGSFLVEVYWVAWLYEADRPEHYEKRFQTTKEAEAFYDDLKEIRQVRKRMKEVAKS